jgi:DNA-binding transcriptional LysR family regulator
MDLVALRHFIAVGQLGSFTRAAEAVNSGQPVITRSVQRLEGHLKTKLFERSTRRLSLTPAGALFLREAIQIVDRLNYAANSARLVGQGETASLRIGVCSTIYASWISAAIREFRALRPEVQILLQGMPSDAQRKALSAGAVDVGIQFLIGPMMDGLTHQELVRPPVVVGVPSSWGYGHGSRIRLVDLADRPWLMPERETAPFLYDGSLSLFRKAGFEPMICGTVQDPVNARLMVACGMGALFLYDWGEGRRSADVDMLVLDEADAGTGPAAVVAWPTLAASQLVTELVECFQRSAALAQVSAPRY